MNAGGGWYQNSKIADIYYTAFPAPDYVNNYGNTIYNSCAAPSLTATQYDMTKGFCGKVNGVNYAVHYVITNRICETGRTLDSATGNCVVKEEANSMKPANQMPCEVTKRTDGSLYIDRRNPVCSDLASKIKTSADGKKITFESGMEKVLSLLWAALLVVFFDIKSRREEAWLAARFPAYSDYRRRVRKLIPFIY